MSQKPPGSTSSSGSSAFGAGTFYNVFDFSREELIERSTIAGQIRPLLQKFFLTKDQVSAIVEGIKSVAQLSDVTLLVIVGWGLVPFMKLWYDKLVADATPRTTDSPSISDDKAPNSDGTQEFRLTRPFEKTKLFHFFNTLSELAKLGMLVYLADLVKIFLLGAGFEIPKSNRLTHVFSYVIYTIWIFYRLSVVKGYVLSKMVKRSRADPGRIQVINRFADAGLLVLAVFVLYEILNLQMGLALRGVVAVGSVWTLVVSLAIKDIASNFFYGFLLAASDRIYEGDSIQLSKSGFKGQVYRLGWLETVLRGSDDIMVTVPNSELLGNHISNLSRIRICQVYQTLRFPYSEVEKLPKLTHDIKCEIRSTCPSVITDGSRPFRCFWTNFQPDHLEVVVDAHFRIKPVGDAYWDNRQRVLQAIDRAVKDNEMKYHGI
ncbi:mechanosensitive ion channel [Nitzschia inconspicua]|uniref:Mechanosensitive ion channel n=1 Tax=Nitzschia inconspicua TaxID=303405 RepID=A0A9K3KJH9_9STRA|nr:mechanosensitive ion channel [Nitzschia inconspicua]